MLRNRNYLLRLWFRFLKIYGPVPAPYLDYKKQFKKQNLLL